jgi:Type I phosphodiesterase / nucleotide pyrophosphatase
MPLPPQLPLPGGVVLPDYGGGSIVNLMTSIAAGLGVSDPAGVPLTTAAWSALLCERARIILLVVDGLGYRRLTTTPGCNALRAHLRGSLTSVFPSTTASAITTFLTGLAPSQHALTGWHIWFPEQATVGAILPYRSRVGDRPLTALGIEPEQLFTHRSFFQRLPVRSYAIAPERILGSVYNRAHCRGAELRGYASLEQLFEASLNCLRFSHERCYVYAYYADYDSTAHEHGVDSRPALRLLQRVDEAFGAFLHAAAGLDATVIVTADHGFIDSPPPSIVELDRHPRLQILLRAPLCGERRAAYCYVQPDATEQFEQYIASELSQQAWACSSKTLIDAGWFGPAPPHAALAQRTGDYTLVMKDNWTIKQWLPGEQRHRQIGVHGGVSEDEMLVPLVIASP